MYDSKRFELTNRLDEHDGTSGPTTRLLREKLVFACAIQRQRIVLFFFTTRPKSTWSVRTVMIRCFAVHMCCHAETMSITTRIKAPSGQKNVCIHSKVGARHQPNVGCHVVSCVRFNMEGFQAVGEDVVNSRSF